MNNPTERIFQAQSQVAYYKSEKAAYERQIAPSLAQGHTLDPCCTRYADVLAWFDQRINQLEQLIADIAAHEAGRQLANATSGSHLQPPAAAIIQPCTRTETRQQTSRASSHAAP